MLTAGESAPRGRTPRPWAASLQRPAAKILVAGGLTLAGWLLGAALSGSTASAAEAPSCPEAPTVSTVDHATKPFSHARHRKSHHGTGALTCTVTPKTGTAGPAPADETQQDGETAPAPETTKDTSPAEEPAKTTKATSPDSSPAEASKATSPDSPPAEASKATSTGGNLLGLVGNALEAVGGASGTTKDTSAGEEPATTKATSAGGDLLGGLVGGVLDVVGGTLSTVTGTVGAVTNTLSHTVLAPLTQPPADNPGAPALLPLDDLLGPVLGGGSNSGGVTAIVPTVTIVVTQGQAVVTETVPATVSEAVAVPETVASPQQQTTRVGLGHLVVRQTQPLPVVEDQPRDSGTHLRNGGGSDPAPGLPGGTTAPSAPAPTAAPGHDGPGGARHAFAVHTDDVTTTQLKLIGTSRDHEVDGAGREAALPTTSPD
ncbi:hypothetical protein AB0F15_01040 [Amycolatopsis sp. NPDC026612]|uniref:hypothetical protein n=1 Tax=Amycolatopsis sp. NPDC026612 TaxID=3155466 RepID=UPI0033F1E9AB